MAGTAAALRVDLQRRRITLTEGERLDEWRIDQVRKASAAYGRAWCIVFEDATRLIGRVRMTPAATMLLWWALAHLHPRSWTKVTHTDVAAALGLERSAVSKAVAELVERGVLMRGEQGYRLSLWLCWQGTAGAYQKEKRGRVAEIERAREWHTSRASGSCDADPVRYWRSEAEPGLTVVKHGARRRRAKAEPEPLRIGQGPKPPQYTDAEWEAIVADAEAAMRRE